MEELKVDAESDTKPFLCDMCHEVFTNQNDYLHHKVTLCSEAPRTLAEPHIKPVLCNMCNEAFIDMNSLLSHKEQHGLSECEDETDIKPYLCDICYAVFTDVDSLVSHKEQHSFPQRNDSEELSASEAGRKTNISSAHCLSRPNNTNIKPDTPINVYTRFCLNTAKSKFSLVSPVTD